MAEFDKKISDHIDKKRARAVRLARSLIRIPTVNPPGKNYKEITDLLERELKGVGLRTRRIMTPAPVLKRRGVEKAKSSPRVNLLADWKAGSKKTLHINGHYDVVPAIGKWRYPPFKGVLKGDRLYGRGAEDMKGTMTAMILAVSALKELGIAPQVNLQLSFTPDEETGGRTGFGWLLEKGLVKADCAMSEGDAGAGVSCGNKGIVWMRIDCIGKTAHASVPYRGVNAFDAMVELAGVLKKLNTKIGRRRTRFKTEKERDRFSTMVMGGELEGGSKVNVVPPMVSFSVDRRLIPEEDPRRAVEEIREALRACSRRNKNFKYRMRVLNQDGAVAFRTDEEICRAISDAIKKVLKKRPRFLLMAGGTDMRYLIKRGIPSVGYSARGGESWHSDNEFVFVKSILETTKIYAMTIMGLKG